MEEVTPDDTKRVQAKVVEKWKWVKARRVRGRSRLGLGDGAFFGGTWGGGREVKTDCAFLCGLCLSSLCQIPLLMPARTGHQL